ncbi:hypothetical protein [Paenibacillus sp. FSL K6-2859]|uniref:hypothetical protein n=1 Tax=Paenibacillus sp. FSL K6-2859 TaxID=2921482 RepID=UPI0030FAF54C
MTTYNRLNEIKRSRCMHIKKATITEINIINMRITGKKIGNLLVSDQSGEGRIKIFAHTPEDIEKIEQLVVNQQIDFKGTAEIDGFEHQLSILVKDYSSR